MRTTFLSLSASDESFLLEQGVHAVISSGAFVQVTSLSLSSCYLPDGLRDHVPLLIHLTLKDVSGTSSRLSRLLSGVAHIELSSVYPPDIMIEGSCCEFLRVENSDVEDDDPVLDIHFSEQSLPRELHVPEKVVVTSEFS